MSAKLTTNIDLSKISLIIPKTVMQEIGVKFRVYRHNVVMSKRQMHDLSAMPPLKPETIARKAGIHKMGKRRGAAAVEVQMISGKWRKSFHTSWEGDEDEGTGKRVRTFAGMKAVKGKRGFISAYPDTPLVDSGNMVSEQALKLVAKDGYLEIKQGPTRAEIAEYHNEGSGHLPQRVHLSFNQEFMDRELHQSLEMWIDRVFRETGTRVTGLA